MVPYGVSVRCFFLASAKFCGKQIISFFEDYYKFQKFMVQYFIYTTIFVSKFCVDFKNK